MSSRSMSTEMCRVLVWLLTNRGRPLSPLLHFDAVYKGFVGGVLLMHDVILSRRIIGVTVVFEDLATTFKKRM